jgi:LCP family protein required for cell wall assembly
MKRKLFLIIPVALIITILGGIFYGYSIVDKTKKTELPKDNKELGIAESAANDSKYKNDDIVNIAFFGLDRTSPDLASRSDSIIIMTIDNKNKTVKATSLMRDMYVQIPGKGSNRINAAYAFGGPLLAIKTINSNFDLNIRDYVTVDFFGLEKLIDKVGGVQIDVSDKEAKVLNSYLGQLNMLNKSNVPFVKGGVQILNGRQAVAYSRIRYVGNGDYERTQRQRDVLSLVFQKIQSQGIGKLPGTIEEIMPYVETSLSNSDIFKIAFDAGEFSSVSLKQYRLPADGTFKSQRIRGMAVLVPDIAQNKSQLLKFIYGVQGS